MQWQGGAFLAYMLSIRELGPLRRHEGSINEINRLTI